MQLKVFLLNLVAETINCKNLICQCHLGLGYSYYYSSLFQQSIKEATKVYNMADEIKDESMLRESYLLKSMCYISFFYVLFFFNLFKIN